MVKKVAFSICTIQEYPVILGDNPACATGVPVTLGWRPVQQSTTEVELHDYIRSNQRRRGRALLIPVLERTLMVINSGASMGEVADAVLLVDQIQKERAETINTSELGEKIQIFQENLSKLPKGIAKNILKIGLKTKQNTVHARSA